MRQPYWRLSTQALILLGVLLRKICKHRAGTQRLDGPGSSFQRESAVVAEPLHTPDMFPKLVFSLAASGMCHFFFVGQD